MIQTGKMKKENNFPVVEIVGVGSEIGWVQCECLHGQRSATTLRHCDRNSSHTHTQRLVQVCKVK